MKTLSNILPLSLGAVMIATVASAAGRPDVARLAEAKQQLAAKAQGQKGYPRARLDQERLWISNVIDDLEPSSERIEPTARARGRVSWIAVFSLCPCHSGATLER